MKLFIYLFMVNRTGFNAWMTAQLQTMLQETRSWWDMISVMQEHLEEKKT